MVHLNYLFSSERSTRVSLFPVRNPTLYNFICFQPKENQFPRAYIKRKGLEHINEHLNYWRVNNCANIKDGAVIRLWLSWNEKRKNLTGLRADHIFLLTFPFYLLFFSVFYFFSLGICIVSLKVSSHSLNGFKIGKSKMFLLYLGVYNTGVRE